MRGIAFLLIAGNLEACVSQDGPTRELSVSVRQEKQAARQNEDR